MPVQHPQLLLLDEPTAGMSRLDTNRTIDLLQKIKERGMTKVIIEHDMHVVFSPRRPRHRAGAGTHHRRRAPGRSARRPEGPGSLSRRSPSVTTRDGTTPNPPAAEPVPAAARAYFSLPRHPRLLRRELRRSGRLARRPRGRDPRAARPQRRRQDLDAPRHRACWTARSCSAARSGSPASRCTGCGRSRRRRRASSSCRRTAASSAA